MNSQKLTKIELNKEYYDSVGSVKTLCFVEKNYIVAKRKGCTPFIVTLNNFSQRFNKDKR